VVSQFSDDIIVMYAGRCVESSPKKELLMKPKHPYTVGLIRSVPLLEARKTKRLKSIPGFPPDMSNVPPGCPFAPRCEYAREKCLTEIPELREVDENHLCACHYPLTMISSKIRNWGESMHRPLNYKNRSGSGAEKQRRALSSNLKSSIR
jgi:oligopeptide/dipeptide ABC transporter ATP-binding protein